MAGGKVRSNRLMWFATGAATMALYLMGPHRLVSEAYSLADSAATWVNAL